MSEFKVTDGHCQFCGTEIKLRFHQDCPIDAMQTWKSIAACNECADNRRIMYQLEERITKAAAAWMAVIFSGEKRDYEPEFRKKFEALTKSYCTAVCGAFRRDNEWLADLVDDLIGRPKYAYAILKDYVAMFKPLEPTGPFQEELQVVEGSGDPF